MRRYIDADKLQEEFKELHGGKRSLLIDAQPTADVRENFKAMYLYDPVQMAYRCSNCNQLFVCRELSPEPPSFNYCPNCGADMRGEV